MPVMRARRFVFCSLGAPSSRRDDPFATCASTDGAEVCIELGRGWRLGGPIREVPLQASQGFLYPSERRGGGENRTDDDGEEDNVDAHVREHSTSHPQNRGQDEY